jgi:hypothetical protein
MHTRWFALRTRRPAPFFLRNPEVMVMVENHLSAEGTKDKVTATANGHGVRAVGDGENRPASGKPSPIGNGSNRGPAAQTPNAAAARGPDGRYAEGNPGGPGNPFTRQVAALRQAAVAAITPDDVRAIVAKMAELALAGDVQAAKLVLAYALGKPAAAADPDRLDVQEWNHFKEAAPMLSEMESLLTPNPRVLLESVRWGRQARTWDFADGVAAALGAPKPPSTSFRSRSGRVVKKRERCDAIKQPS